jgi:hypothetical protein
MSGASDTLSAAIEWLETEISRTPFGRLSIGVQTHGGQISKIFKSVEESTLASQPENGRASDGNGR